MRLKVPVGLQGLGCVNWPVEVPPECAQLEITGFPDDGHDDEGKHDAESQRKWMQLGRHLHETSPVERSHAFAERTLTGREQEHGPQQRKGEDRQGLEIHPGMRVVLSMSSSTNAQCEVSKLGASWRYTTCTAAAPASASSAAHSNALWRPPTTSTRAP